MPCARKKPSFSPGSRSSTLHPACLRTEFFSDTTVGLASFTVSLGPGSRSFAAKQCRFSARTAAIKATCMSNKRECTHAQLSHCQEVEVGYVPGFLIVVCGPVRTLQVWLGSRREAFIRDISQTFFFPSVCLFSPSG